MPAVGLLLCTLHGAACAHNPCCLIGVPIFPPASYTLPLDRRLQPELYACVDLTSTPQVPFSRALMVLNSGYFGYDRG